MELSLNEQALALLYFFSGGLALGIVYDMLRPIRRRLSAGWIPDILFCAIAAAASFVMAMSAGSGRVGTWELMSTLLGFCLYINCASRFILPLFDKAIHILETIFISLKTLIKKISLHAKKILSKKT